MSKWKCEVCGNEFENFHSQRFDNKIYCPLCFLKKENKNLKQALIDIREYVHKNEYCRFGHIDGVEADEIYKKIDKVLGGSDKNWSQ